MKHAKQNEKKKIKISNILLVLLIIIAIAIAITIAIKYNNRANNEKEVQKVVSEVQTITSNENTNQEIPYVQYEGYQVIGIIKIPKINIKYPILAESTEKSLEKSVTRVGNGIVNEIGNLAIAGHNYLNSTMFGNISKLEDKDEIYILDLYGNEVKYSVFSKYVTDPNDITVLEPVESDKKEITLITCTNGNKNRLIIRAREF